MGKNWLWNLQSNARTVGSLFYLANRNRRDPGLSLFICRIDTVTRHVHLIFQMNSSQYLSSYCILHYCIAPKRSWCIQTYNISDKTSTKEERKCTYKAGKLSLWFCYLDTAFHQIECYGVVGFVVTWSGVQLKHSVLSEQGILLFNLHQDMPTDAWWHGTRYKDALGTIRNCIKESICFVSNIHFPCMWRPYENSAIKQAFKG